MNYQAAPEGAVAMEAIPTAALIRTRAPGNIPETSY